MDLRRLEELRKRKRKYYAKKEKEGEILYGMGGDNQLKNTVEDRGKRRYGFRRATVRQPHRLPKAVLKHKLNNKFKCYKFQSYLSYNQVNSLSNNHVHDLLALIYTKYSDPNQLLEDYFWGFRDPLFKKIVSLTGIAKDPERMDRFLNDYNDLIIEALIKFVDEMNNYVESSTTSFYSYIVNIIPFRFASLFSSLFNDKEHVIIDTDEIIDETYDIDCSGNQLGLYILNNFKSIR